MLGLQSEGEAMSLDLFPVVSFDLIPDGMADVLLVEWGHWLGAPNRPFGRQSFGLHIADVGVVSVAVSCSTVNEHCAGFDRSAIVELARCASHPDHKWASRVTLRLWRQLAPRFWSEKYWPVVACVSYSNALRHTGNLYRFDGWTKFGRVRGGKSGKTWQRGTGSGKVIEAKDVWFYPVERRAEERQQA